MKAVSISYFRRNMKACLDQVSKDQDELVVTRHGDGEQAVVVISNKEYNTLLETAHLLSTTANSKRLERSIENLKR